MIEVKLKPEKPFTNKELADIRKKNPDIDFRMEIKKGKQYIYVKIPEKTDIIV